MKLSIAFITNNRKEELLRALLSCKNNINHLINSADIEYVIVDNASTDNTEEFIKSNIDIDNLIYKYSIVNLGVAGGRNLAFELCSGEYIFFLDDDAVLSSENFFDSIILFMDKHPEIVAASPNIQEPLTQTNLNSKNKCFEKELNLILCFCGCAHILRRDFYENKVLYPNNLKFGSEELYASLQAYAYDKLIVEYNDVKVEHYPSGINRCDGDERKFNFIFNQYLIKKLLYPKQVMWLTWGCYYLHKIKNGFCTNKWRKLAKKYYIERYDEFCVSRISIKHWIQIIRKFGWRLAM